MAVVMDGADGEDWEEAVLIQAATEECGKFEAFGSRDSGI
jgi:hypothetical protein